MPEGKAFVSQSFNIFTNIVKAIFTTIVKAVHKILEIFHFPFLPNKTVYMSSRGGKSEKKTQLIFVKVALKQTGVIQFKKQLPKLFLKMV